MKFKLIGENDLEIFGEENNEIKLNSKKPHFDNILIAINKKTNKIRIANRKDLDNITYFDNPYDFVYENFDSDFRYNRHFVEIPNKEV